METKNFSTTLQNSDVKSIAIGGFDGIHLAHQKLISYLDKNSVVVIIDKKNASITPNRYRCKYIPCLCKFLDFEKIKEFTAEEFIDFLLSLYPNLQKIVVGYDFKFAKDAKSDVNTLKLLFAHDVIVVDEVKKGSISVHSKIIRQLLYDGKIKEANQLLTREYQIVGQIIKGQGLGKKSLFPTINIKSKDFLIPKMGVYATFTTIDDKSYPSATFIGNRISTDNKFSIETHVLDKKLENIKNSKVYIDFVSYIRENKKFESLDLLKNQISKDLLTIRKLLS